MKKTVLIPVLFLIILPVASVASSPIDIQRLPNAGVNPQLIEDAKGNPSPEMMFLINHKVHEEAYILREEKNLRYDDVTYKLVAFNSDANPKKPIRTRGQARFFTDAENEEEVFTINRREHILTRAIYVVRHDPKDKTNRIETYFFTKDGFIIQRKTFVPRERWEKEFEAEVGVVLKIVSHDDFEGFGQLFYCAFLKHERVPFRSNSN